MWLKLLLLWSASLTPAVLLAQVEVVPRPSSEPVSSAVQPRQVYHSGWGYLSSAGVLTGKVYGIHGVGKLEPQVGTTVTLSQNLAVLASGKTDRNGNFSFSGLDPGVFEIATESTAGYSIYSFQALYASGGAAAQPMLVFASSLQHSRVDELLNSLWAPSDTLPSGARPFEEVLAPFIAASQSQRVAIINGRVSGQVAFGNPNNVPEAHVVKVFRNGTLLADASVDSLGTFSFAAPAPGPIDVVLGGSAFAAFGAELVDASQLAREQQSPVQFVSANLQSPPASPTLLVPAVGGTNQGPTATSPAAMPGGIPPMAMAGGFGPGGSFGGGGSGGGFGGGMNGLGIAGALLGGAGLAVGIAALDDDDDGFEVNVSTPIVR
jgi:hypothetical protein